MSVKLAAIRLSLSVIAGDFINGEKQKRRSIF